MTESRSTNKPNRICARSLKSPSEVFVVNLGGDTALMRYHNGRWELYTLDECPELVADGLQQVLALLDGMD